MGSEATKLIQRSIKSKEKYLDLGSCSLTDEDVFEGTEFDKLLRQCTHLESLILSDEWYEDATKVLSSNALGNNFFNTLPPSLEELVSLTTLVCSGTYENKWGITKMQFVANLSGLQTLNLSNNQITEIKGLDKLIYLNSLNISNNQITEIKGLDKLTNLNSLNIFNNKITEIKGLDNLTDLTSLELTNNEITEIKGLDKLTNLNSLDISNNKITEIKGLDKLTNLNLLGVSGNQITEIKGLDKLTNLNSLDVDSNQITEIKGLDKLTNLNSLDISNNKITEIKGLDNLTNLYQIVLRSNLITEIKGLRKLANLKELYIGNNKINEIKGLDSLVNLDFLSIWDNQVTEIKGLDKLTNLKSLNISSNQISEIQGLIPFFHRSVNIEVKNNPIVTPPMSIVEQGNEAIIRFFSEDLEAKYEAKILIVGEPEAGKTSLMKKITNPAYVIPAEEDSTIGIQVIKWECNNTALPEPIKINMWDFGGQEMQYLTHQFFLSADALYLLLTSARKDYDNLDYWFNIISLLGKNENNQNSELLVVANEIKMPEGQIAKSFDAKKYQDLYPHLPFTFQPVNLATAFDKDGRFAVLQNLIHEKLALLPILGKQLPVKWGIARRMLTNLNVNYLPIDQYLGVCKKTDIDEKLALDLSNYLHTIGEAVHFKTDDYVILNPKWAVDGMYSILKRKEIEENDGLFTQEEVYRIWKNTGYSHPECNLLLSLMTKDSFEVAYKIPATKDEYIAPQLLSLIQPECDWNKKGALHFRYFYPFIPKGIITRLIVRLHKHIKYQDSKGLVWRTGVVFEKNGCIAKVEEIKIPKTGQQVIAIEVSGHQVNRKLLLYDICNSIEGIHKDSFSKIIFERQIPCNCEYCTSLEEPGFYDYSELIEYLNEGIEKIRCKLKVKNELSVKLLLQDIFDVDFTKLDYINHLDLKKETVNELLFNNPFGVNKTDKRKKKIFISYSQKDTRFQFTNGVKLDFIEGLKTHLKSLNRLGFADTWSDKDILAGADWDEKIKAELADADIILFLLSANLIATDYVWDEEMPLAKYHKENKNTIIIPVILNPCQWESIPIFSKQNAVPYKGKPVASFNNVDEAYNEITTKIKALLEK